MKISFKILIAICCCAVSLTAQTYHLDVTELQKGFDELIKFHTDEDNFRGRVIIDRGGQTIYAKDNGLANFKTKRPYTDTTRFAIASITKSFTAAAILLLEQDGKLNLDDLIAQHLPQLAKHPDVTINHLLTHSAGLSYSSFGMREIMKLGKGEVNTLSKVLNWIESKYEEPFFPPGEKAQYSNIGYDILGALIEKLSGKSYATFLKSRIFDPLEMTTAEVRPVVVLDDKPGYAIPRLLTWKGRKEKKFSYAVVAKDYTEPCSAMGSYGIYISVADLVKLRKLWGTDVLLSSKNRKAYVASPELPDGKPNYWRYGCLSTKTPHLESSNIRMGGSQPGFLSFVIFYPEYDLTIAMVTNSSPMYNRYVFSPNVINNYKEIKPILYRAFTVEVPEKETEK